MKENQHLFEQLNTENQNAAILNVTLGVAVCVAVSLLWTKPSISDGGASPEETVAKE